MTVSSSNDLQVVSCQGEEPLSSYKSEQDLTVQTKIESFQHPKIYLNFGDKAEIICPYCSRIFYKTLS